MKVKRIISNIATASPAHAAAFYEEILGLELAMDHGWIRTYAGTAKMAVQLSFASEGGSGTAVPDLSIEVDDLNEVLGSFTSPAYLWNTALPMNLGVSAAFT